MKILSTDELVREALEVQRKGKATNLTVEVYAKTFAALMATEEYIYSGTLDDIRIVGAFFVGEHNKRERLRIDQSPKPN